MTSSWSDTSILHSYPVKNPALIFRSIQWGILPNSNSLGTSWWCKKWECVSIRVHINRGALDIVAASFILGGNPHLCFGMFVIRCKWYFYYYYQKLLGNIWWDNCVMEGGADGIVVPHFLFLFFQVNGDRFCIDLVEASTIRGGCEA